MSTFSQKLLPYYNVLLAYLVKIHLFVDVHIIFLPCCILFGCQDDIELVTENLDKSKYQVTQMPQHMKSMLYLFYFFVVARMT